MQMNAINHVSRNENDKHFNAAATKHNEYEERMSDHLWCPAGWRTKKMTTLRPGNPAVQLASESNILRLRLPNIANNSNLGL